MGLMNHFKDSSEVVDDAPEKEGKLSRNELMKQPKNIKVIRNGIEIKCRKGALQSFINSGWKKV